MGKGQQKKPVFAVLKAHWCLQERSRNLRKLVSFPIHRWKKSIWNKPRSCLVETYLCNEQLLQSLLYLIQFSKGQIPKQISVTLNQTAKWWLYALAEYHILETVPHGNNVNLKTEGAVSSFNYCKFHIYVKNNICFLFKESVEF